MSADGIIVQEGTSNDDYAMGVVLANGLPIVSGESKADFPGMTNTNAGTWDAIVKKYNTDGTQAAIKTFATSSSEGIYATTIDDSNNVYVAGYTQADLAGSQGGNDIFVAKLDSSLTQIWLIQDGTSSGDLARAVAIDSASRVIVGGYTSGGAFPDHTNLGSSDCFIMQYSSTGTREWVIQFGSTDADDLNGLAVDTVGSVDDIYGTGYGHDGFDGQSSSGSRDIFLIKV